MGHRLTLPLLLLAALLAGGAFYWMSGSSQRSGSTLASPVARSEASSDRAPAALAKPDAPAVAPSAPARVADETPTAPAVLSASKSKEKVESVALSGRVVDRFGTPVAGARVVMAADAGFPLDLELQNEFTWLRRQRTETDADGRFRFAEVEPGTRQLGVRARGFAPYEQRGVAIPKAAHELEPITLARGAILSGQVVDENGRGVGGARIVRQELEQGGFFFLGSREPTAGADADGRFRIDELACGAWRFLVQSEEHPDLAVEGVSEEPGVEQDALRWQVAPGATIHGTVTAIPSAERGQLEVRAQHASSPTEFGFGPSRLAKVAENGAFTLQGLDMGEAYSLQARRARSEQESDFWERSRSNTVEARAGETGVVLSYQPEASIVFGVFDAKTRAPLERFEVEAGIEWPIPLRDDEGRPRTRFPGGSVRVGGLRPGSDQERVQLRVKATGYAELARDDIAVRGGQELDLGPLYLEPMPLVRVRVTDQRTGAPIAGATVRVQKQANGNFNVRRGISVTNDGGEESIDFGEGRSATTGDDGWAEVTSYEGETVDVSARAQGHAPAKREGLSLPRGERVELELALSEGGAVLVHVLDAGGAALAGAQVEHKASGAGPEGGVFVLGGPAPGGEASDSRGEVLFQNLAEGVHSFRLSERRGGGMFAHMDGVFIADGGGSEGESWTQVQVAEGERAEVTLRAAPSSELTGHVREAGKVLAGAKVSLRKENAGGDAPRMMFPGMDSGPEGKTDGEGAFEIDGIKVGRYTLSVEHPTRRMPAEFPLELREGKNTFDVDLPLTILSGRVTDSEGKGLPGVRVWPERKNEEGGGRNVRMQMIVVDDGGGGGIIDPGQFGEKTVTDAEGRYSLRGVTSDVELVVKAEGDTVQPGESPVLRVSPNEVRDNVDLRLEVAGSIRVEAKLADGSPARFQLVQAEFQGETETPLQPKFSFMQQGSTELTGLKPGRWKVTVRSAQGGPGPNNPGEEQVIEVQPSVKATASFEVD